MALLQIPDNYAQERGGWKNDKIMKKVYIQTFSEERKMVDSKIDSYFESKIQHEIQHEKKKAQYLLGFSRARDGTRTRQTLTPKNCVIALFPLFMRILNSRKFYLNIIFDTILQYLRQKDNTKYNTKYLKFKCINILSIIHRFAFSTVRLLFCKFPCLLIFSLFSISFA